MADIIKLIDADTVVIFKVFDEMTGEWYEEKMTLAEVLDSWTETWKEAEKCGKVD